MPEPIAAQMRAAVPAGDDDYCVLNPLAGHHLQDDHACTALAVVVLDLGAVRQAGGPCVVGGLGKFLGLLETFEKILDVGVAANTTSAHRIFGAAIAHDPDMLNECAFNLHR